MLPGPVFNIELLTTARRARYYALRLLYGLIILFVLFQNFYVMAMMYGATIPPRRMSELAGRVFWTVAGVQVAAVMVLSPTLVAGVIASERQRKTLHYLLASRLTSGEIILGKLCARMLHVAVFMAISLPVVSLLSLFGGVDPILVVAVYACTFSLAYFLAAISILVSASTKRVREAISATYSLELVWLIVPPIVRTVMPSQWPEIYSAVGPANDWILATNPFSVLFAARGGGVTAVTGVVWMVGLQLLVGSVAVALAVWRLRPYAKKEDKAGVRKWMFRAFPRAAVGDDAMLWKERYASKATGLSKVITTVIMVMLSCVLIYWTLYFCIPSAREAWVNRFGNISSFGARENFNVFLRVCCTILCSLAALGAATGGANVFTSEKEDDTWISLLATPLEPIEIVRAKLLGVVWKSCAAFAAAALLGILGVVCGALHPLGLLAFTLEAAVFVGFAVALGSFLSLRSQTTWRSQSIAVAILVVANGGYLACICPVLALFSRQSLLFYGGCMPFVEAIALFSAENLAQLQDGTGPPAEMVAEFVVTSALSILTYGVAGVLLALGCIRGFDAAADRPRASPISFNPWAAKSKRAKADPLDPDVVFE